MASDFDTLKAGIVTQLKTLTGFDNLQVVRGPEHKDTGAPLVVVDFGSRSVFNRSQSGVIYRIIDLTVFVSGDRTDNSDTAEDVLLLFLPSGAGTPHQALIDLAVGFVDMVPVELVEVDQTSDNESVSNVSFEIKMRYQY